MDHRDLPPFSRPVTVTVPTALRLTGLGRTKFYELINEGRIKTVTVGRRRLVVYSSLEALAE
jgi:excisionase family DNA binding protein